MIKVIYTGTRAPQPPAGLELVHLPMLERVALPLPDDVAVELANPDRAHRHAVFYSQNAVEVVFDEFGPDPFVGVELWAVGERTAESIEERTGAQVRSPKRQDFVGVTDELRKVVLGNDVVVSFEIAGSERRLDEMVLPARILSVAAYDTVPTNWDDLDGLLRRIAPRWVVFGSPRAFAVFRDNLHHRVVGDSYRVAAIGPSTRDAIERAGDRVDLVPDQPDLDHLLAEIAEIG